MKHSKINYKTLSDDGVQKESIIALSTFFMELCPFENFNMEILLSFGSLTLKLF